MHGTENLTPWSAKETTHHSFDSYGVELGLPGTVVTAALQTRDGYMWVATPSGLARFDGHRFVSFSSASTPGLPGDLIHCLHEDRRGVLWIGTDKGLARFAEGRFARAGLDGVAVRAVAEGPSGAVCVGTWERGLYWVRGERAPEPIVSAGLPEPLRVRALFVDSRETVWIAQERSRGVWRIDRDGLLQRVDGDGDGAGLGEVLCFCEPVPGGALWLGTKRDGLFRWKDEQLTRGEEAIGAGTGPIYEIRRARAGGVWLAAGVLKYAPSAEQPVFEVIPGLPNRNVQSLAEDVEGGLWLCAVAEGLTRMRELPYQLRSVRQGLPTDNIKNVTEDPLGGLWLATQESGVVHVEASGMVKPQRGTGGLPDGDTAVVYAARDGSVWAGISSHLWVRRDGVWSQHPEMRFVRGLFEDRRGTMWIGTELDGLFRFEQGKFTEIKTDAGGHIALATSFAEAPDGALVVGTWRSGLWRVAAGESVARDCLRGFPGQEVRAVHVDREGRIWAGINRRGLIVSENGRWWNPPTSHQAFGSSVSAIIEEDSGRLWLGTLAGVLWAQKEELLAWMRAPASAPPVHAIPAGDETGIIPVWSGAQPVAWRAGNGDFLFATRRGVLAIDPHRVVLNRVPPPVHLEDVLVDRRSVGTREGVKLPPGTRSLAIDYTAPSFVQAGRVLFRYKLEGYDADWVDAGTRRAAYYGSLPQGNFVFRVVACNSDGVWSETGAKLAIVQLPYFHQTAWFAWLLAGLLAVAVWGLYRWSNRRLRLKLERLERERAMENERRRIAQDLHDDLGASLTELGLFAEAHRQAVPTDAQPMLSYLSQRARTLVSSLDAIVWAVNPANDSLDHLVAYIGELFQELFRASTIRVRLDLPADIPRLPLRAEERSDIFLTTKEAMNNILKHSDATEAFLRVRMDGRELRITVQDNGRGFDPHAATATGGNGLTNMRTRIARARGQVEWRTAPGQGTEITIVVSFDDRKELPAPPE
jgi:signal transduction histidine kinase/ligand-binding sensor domain-containing protein